MCVHVMCRSVTIDSTCNHVHLLCLMELLETDVGRSEVSAVVLLEQYVCHVCVYVGLYKVCVIPCIMLVFGIPTSP